VNVELVTIRGNQKRRFEESDKRVHVEEKWPVAKL